MKTLVKIGLTAIILIVVIVSMYSFDYTHSTAQYAYILGIAQGVMLGTIIMYSVLLRELRKEKKSNARLSKEIVKLADEKRQAQVNAAEYKTQTVELNAQIKELKQFREGVAATVKELAGKMKQFLGEDEIQPKRTETVPCISINGNELMLGRPLAS